MVSRMIWLIALAWLVTGTPVRAEDLGPGKFLVARRNLPDPNFVQTVILLAQYEEKGALGLVINRVTEFPVSRVLADFKGAAKRSDFVYSGGPVARTGVLSLLRSSSSPGDARHIFADVYLVSSKALLEKSLAAGAESERLRIYLGYAGWTAGQLQQELKLGTWHVMRADPAVVFDSDPASVWNRMIERAQIRLAFGPVLSSCEAGACARATPVAACPLAGPKP